MAETNETRYHTGDTLSDVWRFLSDASYAVLPRDVAYKFGEFEKNFWGSVGWLADKKIGWIDEALRGGDCLREEWQRRGTRESQTQTPPPDGMG
ncbi:MAG TPA: hypothetical protein VK388_12695 [Pyrinomonadaceae bacterium]|nr:hypothetical protein [Pyrinomonadaceae bacterium]